MTCEPPWESLDTVLRSMTGTAVLRSADLHAALRRGGDIDLLVLDAVQAERDLVTALGPPMSVARRSYVTSLYYAWGGIDLVSSLEWRGASYLDAGRVVREGSVAGDGLRRPRAAHDAAISWFSSLLAGGFFPDRYRERIGAAADADGPELERLLTDAVGRRWGRRLWSALVAGTPEESQAWVPQLRRAVLVTAVRRSPATTAAAWLRFWGAELRLRAHPPLPWIALLGPDGAGKSTVLEQIRQGFPGAVGTVRAHHWRPTVLRSRTESEGPVLDPHGTPPRGPALSALALLWVVADWWLGYWGRVVHQRAHQELVVFDRHLLDILVDPRRYRYGGPSWLARLAVRVVPRPDIVLVLDAPTAVLRARKQEVTPAETTRQRAAYRDLAERLPGARLVDVTARVDEVGETVRAILDEQLAGDAAAGPRCATGGLR